MLPPLADIDDLLIRLGDETLEGVDLARAEAALSDASTLVRSEARTTWVTEDDLDEDIPDVIVMVTLAVARRGLQNPDGYRQETLGDHSVTYAGSDSLYLTDDEKALIGSAVSTGPVGLWTLATTRCDPADAADLPDIYLDVTGSEQIPHVPVGEINW